MKPGEWSETTGVGPGESRAGRHTVEHRLRAGPARHRTDRAIGAMHAFVVTAHHPVVPSPSFVLELDRASPGHASVPDAHDGTFVTP